ncbi:MAG TPA: hypothetical protein VGB13_11095 [Candidatus Krumholzibacteria bacterium]|jgi:hypothetical protein
MHRTLLCLCALLAVAAGAPGIELKGVAVKAGASHIASDFQFEGAELFSVDSIVEPSASISLRWKNSPRSRFDFVTELGYLRGGFDVAGEKVRASFLQIPLLLRSDLGGDESSIYLVFGPSLGILVDRDPGFLDRYNDLSLAGQAGLGVFRRVNRRLSIYGEFRFSGDFTNLYSPAGDEDSLTSVRQRVLQLSAGIEF